MVSHFDLSLINFKLRLNSCHLFLMCYLQKLSINIQVLLTSFDSNLVKISKKKNYWKKRTQFSKILLFPTGASVTDALEVPHYNPGIPLSTQTREKLFQGTRERPRPRTQQEPIRLSAPFSTDHALTISINTGQSSSQNKRHTHK